MQLEKFYQNQAQVNMQAQKLCQAQVKGVNRQTAASKLATHVLNSQFTISNLGLDKGCGVKDFFVGILDSDTAVYCGKKIKKNH